jgi:hypothetical protein
MLELTPLGSLTAETATITQPIRLSDKFLFDRFAWVLSPVDMSQKLFKVDADSKGFRVLDAVRTDDITMDDFTVDDVEGIYFSHQRSVRQVDIVRIESLTKRRTGVFLPARMIVYRGAASRHLRGSFVVDDDFSRAHDLALEAMGGVQNLGISLQDDGRVFDTPVKMVQAIEPIRLTQLDTLQEADPVIVESSQSRAEALPRLLSLTVFEHRPFLFKALEEVRERLLIRSPWINSGADIDFASSLERALRRGIKATIIYGYEDDASTNPQALRRLQNLAFRFPKFEILHHENTHTKMLIWDDNLINTSFNWLSFRGDKSRAYRDERGTLLLNSPEVDTWYAQELQEANDHLRPAAVADGDSRSDIGNAPIESVGSAVVGEVKSTTNFGVFVRLPSGHDGLLHISKTGCRSPAELEAQFPICGSLEVRVDSVERDEKRDKINLSLSLA